jgi:hypothetical protein
VSFDQIVMIFIGYIIFFIRDPHPKVEVNTGTYLATTQSGFFSYVHGIQGDWCQGTQVEQKFVTHINFCHPIFQYFIENMVFPLIM